MPQQSTHNEVDHISSQSNGFHPFSSSSSQIWADDSLQVHSTTLESTKTADCLGAKQKKRVSFNDKPEIYYFVPEQHKQTSMPMKEIRTVLHSFGGWSADCLILSTHQPINSTVPQTQLHLLPNRTSTWWQCLAARQRGFRQHHCSHVAVVRQRLAVWPCWHNRAATSSAMFAAGLASSSTRHAAIATFCPELECAVPTLLRLGRDRRHCVISASPTFAANGSVSVGGAASRTATTATAPTDCVVVIIQIMDDFVKNCRAVLVFIEST